MEDIFGTSNIYCLCLEGSSREQKVKERIINAGFPSLKMLYGVKGKDLTLNQLQQYTTPRAFRTITHPGKRIAGEDLESVGALACGLGHRYLWELIVRNGWKRTILFEDDVTFSKDFTRDVISEMLKELQIIDPEWEIFSFGHTNRRDQFQSKIPNSNHFYKCRGMFYGTAGYMITLEGAQKLLRNFFPVDVQVDAYMGLICDELRKDRVRLYFSDKKIVRQESMFSTQIHHNIFQENLKVAFPDSPVNQVIIFIILFIIFYLLYKLGKKRGLKKN